ncbi:hypothetical protein [Blastococcus haudaquaticus]|uniref:Uncharacterized protein n=1 Tax=Blastococcus haudaquaticus TaxID=1938745 RepID=A0A286H471_9ACTN|nr:hypothetical protein [Blastococcus haudaquaticus]SOE02588.1 hypothetical protein SAMN06272739_3645 [Blastococcus haudaquaticus]
MNSSASSAAWLPAAIARAAVVTGPPAQHVPGRRRHAAPEVPGELRIATPEDLLRTGRHAEAAWTRDLPVYDALRDELAAVDWSSLRA